MNVQLKYISREKSGLLLYHRVIPRDVREHYEGRRLLRKSLATHDPHIAVKEALRLAEMDNRIWQALRGGAHSIEAARASVEDTRTLDMVRAMVRAQRVPRHYLADALDIYLRKHRGRDERFVQNAKRAVKTVSGILGNPDLKAVKRADARRVLDAMLGQGLKTASVKRYIGTISAIFSTAILELELDFRNPFAALTIPNAGRDAKAIPSFSEAELRQIATAGLGSADEAGLIATMQINLGCRVAEIAGLRIEDLHLDAPLPFIDIVEHREHGRSLKTPGSARALPLLGCSLEAARLARQAANNSGWLFARIDKKNPASTVNKWLRKVLGGSPGSHMARHSVQTRLVIAGVDQRCIDQIMGHKLKGQGATYFSGFSLADMAAALEKVAIPRQKSRNDL